MTHPVWIGSSVPEGLEQLQMHKKLKLGDSVLTVLPLDKAEAMAVARYCRKHRIHLHFSEVLFRGTTDVCKAHGRKMPRREFHSKADLDEIIDAAGEYYGGRMTIGELGGMLYWPKGYVMRRGEFYGDLPSIPSVKTVAQARDAYVSFLKSVIEFERKEISKGPLMNVEAGLVAKYHAQAGIDVLCLEVMPGDPHLMHAATRGAARAYNKPWGVHIAMNSYAGVCFDELYQKRWKTAVLFSYIAGAGFIYPEKGHYVYDLPETGQRRRGFHSEEVKRVRRVMREAWQFARIHSRPTAGPRVSLGIVHGNLDGAPGLWNRYAWGQYKGRKWVEGPAERGWRLVDKLHRREDWPRETVQGEVDFSGNPPYGQYDVVPIEAPLQILKRYTCLVFLGWNTITPAIYEKLKAYVRAGGRVVMYLPHLSTHTDRGSDLNLCQNGDFRDLFGVRILGKGIKDVTGVKCIAHSSLKSYRFPRWRIRTDSRFLGEFTPAKCKVTTGKVLSAHSGVYSDTLDQLVQQPFLIENSFGKGKAFLVAAWEYPADEGLIRFTEDLLRAVLQGEQGGIRLLSSDRIRYAVYDGTLRDSRRKYRVIYLLNTDPDISFSARLWIRGRMTAPFDIPANTLRLAYCLGSIVVIPEDKRVDLKNWRSRNDRQEIEFFSFANQELQIYNLRDTEIPLSVNGASLRCRPGTFQKATLPRNVDSARKEFFAPGFLKEPFVRYKPAPMPY